MYGTARNLVRVQETPELITGFRDIKQIACGANHVLALDVHGDIWGLGCNDKNQLGRRFRLRHDDELIPTKIRLGRLRTGRSEIKLIASGADHGLALDKDGCAWGWGQNNCAQAGQTPPRTWSSSNLLDRPMPITDLDTPQGIVSMSAGDFHSAAVTHDGRCYLWGRVDRGQLGISFTLADQDETRLRRDMTGQLRTCLRPTMIRHISRVAHVACGADHTIFINTNGDGWATGPGSDGQLGTGHEEDHDVAVRLGGREVQRYKLSWAGAGTEFSVVAGRVGEMQPLPELETGRVHCQLQSELFPSPVLTNS